jgi:site-specific DNA-methyltransferase (adenine-specific)
MARLPANYIDLIIADPPYNLGKDYGKNKDARTSEEYTLFTQNWLEQASSPLCLF